MARHRVTRVRALPSLLVRLIEAAEDAHLPSYAKALRELGAVALWALPSRGIFVATDEEVSSIVDSIANIHLGMAEARRAFQESLSVVEPFATRERLESAHNHVRGTEDEAYYHAGLAFGVVLTSFADHGPGLLVRERSTRAR